MNTFKLEIDDSAQLIFQTYFMQDWSKVRVTDSDHICVTCGRNMKKTGPVMDKKGRVYDGFVCHDCKSLLWMKQD